jgi:ABC-type polar amino acid transport system ATPase subunit
MRAPPEHRHGFQSFNLFPHLTVFGNLLLAPRYHHLAPKPS